MANSGVDATLYFMQSALDYVAEHTPRDQRTLYWEARVFTVKNRGPVRSHTLQSRYRFVP